ncbi:mitochondrial PAP2-like superfamily member [Andalucia godoyi]|uniref:Mitochondrial PAP2-like superfamily member n=1 Tax=Andalucia godoyi TaxID=505711 RepID=A0A8K0AIL1_ANDGO|nr:mitochondrial PAP2-like superfamily member [Andalucia godoyi]|eukprot:ANDGO_02880.mRNA.1 mitochondrial PAP2-like superfamily member (diacylglycerol diphosphate phosphatase / phosphatidate phosphatase)
MIPRARSKLRLSSSSSYSPVQSDSAELFPILDSATSTTVAMSTMRKFLSEHFCVPVPVLFPTRWFVKSYIIDWATVFVIFVVMIFFNQVAAPRSRYIQSEPRDAAYGYPFQHSEIVPVWLLLMFTLAVPLVSFTFFNAVYYRSLHDMHHATTGLCFSVVVANIIVDIVKVSVGYYRPDYWSRVDNGSLVVEGRKSWPSGHAELSFTGLVYLSLYMSAKLGLFRKDRGSAPFWRALLCASPVSLAVFTAASRVVDYRHHPADVITGAVIGSMIAIWGYFVNYPSLFDPFAHLPLSRHPDYFLWLQKTWTHPQNAAMVLMNLAPYFQQVTSTTETLGSTALLSSSRDIERGNIILDFPAPSSTPQPT